MKFRLIINVIGTGALFGIWMKSYDAALFMVVLLGFILSAIDYFKEPKWVICGLIFDLVLGIGNGARMAWLGK